MSVDALSIQALMQYYSYYSDNFKIECPTGSGNLMNLFEVARETASRLTRIFLRDQAGRRPVFGGAEKFQSDPYSRDHLLSMPPPAPVLAPAIRSIGPGWLHP